MSSFIALLFLLIAIPISAQTPQVTLGEAQARFITSKTEVALGEVFTLEVVAELLLDAELVGWIDLSDGNTLQILAVGERQQESNQTAITYRQTFDAVLWRTGTYLTPEAFISYRLQNIVYDIPIISASVFVPSLITADSTMKPFTVPIDLPFIPPYLYVVVGIAFSFITYGIARFAFFRRNRPQKTLDSIASAQQQITELKAQSLPITTTYLYASTILRRVLQDLHIANALELTTFELTTRLRDEEQFSHPLINTLQALLEQADIVKFANLQPEMPITRYLNACSRWLDDLNRSKIELP